MPSRSQSTSKDVPAKKTHTLFLTADNANITFLGSPSWCLLSEMRLLNKLALYKPVGVRKHFNLFALMHAMHYIAEDEDDIDFEEYLLPEDYKIYLERQKMPQRDIMVFPPKYRFRPTSDEIMDKIVEFFDITVLDKFDSTTETFENAPKEYALPTSIANLRK